MTIKKLLLEFELEFGTVVMPHYFGTRQSDIQGANLGAAKQPLSNFGCVMNNRQK